MLDILTGTGVRRKRFLVMNTITGLYWSTIDSGCCVCREEASYLTIIWAKELVARFGNCVMEEVEL